MFIGLTLFLKNIFAFQSPEVTNSVEFIVEYTDSATKDRKQIALQFDLFGKKCPKTVQNFYELSVRKELPNYKNTIFHRVIKDFVIQGGYLENQDGTEFLSIYGGEFDDEISEQNVHVRGTLSMANRGKNTNGSQFFVCTSYQPLSYLNKGYTAFGQLRPEFLDNLDILHKLPTDNQDKPINDISVVEIKDITDPKYVPADIVEVHTEKDIVSGEPMTDGKITKEATQEEQNSGFDSGYNDKYDEEFSDLDMEEFERLYGKQHEEL